MIYALSFGDGMYLFPFLFIDFIFIWFYFLIFFFSLFGGLKEGIEIKESALARS